MQSFLLSNGVRMPSVGLGTWRAYGEDVQKACEHAIDIGYRLIDTAHLYENEHLVGAAVREKIHQGVISRSDIFITSKLWVTHMNPRHVRRETLKSLEKLQMKYVDLYLIHHPMAVRYSEEMFPESAVDPIELLDTWKEMEALVDDGLARAIGVSNFTSDQLTRILNGCRIKPVNQQIECHAFLQQDRQFEFCKEHGIAVTCYGPLGAPYRINRDDPASKDGVLIENPTVVEIATKHCKSPAQVCLRFLLQIGRAVIPKSVTPARIEENFNLFDFELDERDMELLKDLNRNIRLFTMNRWEGLSLHPEYPFNEEL